MPLPMNTAHPARGATPEKKCLWCGETKPSSGFSLCHTARDGLDPTCLACRKSGVDPRKAGKDGLHYCHACVEWLPEDQFRLVWCEKRGKSYRTSPCNECFKAQKRREWAEKPERRAKAKANILAKRAATVRVPRPRRATRTSDPNHPARLATPERECYRCGKVKPALDFHAAPHGLDSTCAECRRTGHNPRKDGLHKCGKCNQWLPAERFYLKDGVPSSPCKRCHNAHCRRRAEDPAFRAWRVEYSSKWQRENKDKVRARQQRRRARKMAAPVNDLTAAQWEEILMVHGHRCAYCLNKFDALEQDHMVALSRGGSHTASNIVPACRSCNARKHDNSIFTMLSR